MEPPRKEYPSYEAHKAGPQHSQLEPRPRHRAAGDGYRAGRVQPGTRPGGPTGSLVQGRRPPGGKRSVVQFEAGRPGEAVGFQIDDQATDQTIAGFGASLLESGLICLNDLPAEKQEAVLRTLFDPVQGQAFRS